MEQSYQFANLVPTLLDIYSFCEILRLLYYQCDCFFQTLNKLQNTISNNKLGEKGYQIYVLCKLIFIKVFKIARRFIKHSFKKKVISCNNFMFQALKSKILFILIFCGLALSQLSGKLTCIACYLPALSILMPVKPHLSRLFVWLFLPYYLSISLASIAPHRLN